MPIFDSGVLAILLPKLVQNQSCCLSVILNNRKTLEKLAAETDFADRIIFTGAMPREDLGVAYKVMNVFTFPSLKDTQGWVLHEAAHAGKPIVIIDKEVSEVVEGRS